MTSIYFKQEDISDTKVVKWADCEVIATDIDCIAALARSIETLLDDADLDNLINTKFRTTTIYDLCVL